MHYGSNYTLLGMRVTKARWCRRRGGPGDWQQCQVAPSSGTLEQLMRSLASMTGTGDLRGGDTLAGGGAAEGGDRMLGLRLSATAGAPRALPARRGKSVEIYAVKRRRREPGSSSMTMTCSSSLGYFPIATKRGA